MDKKEAPQLEGYQFVSQGKGAGRKDSKSIGTRVPLPVAEALAADAAKKGLSSSDIIRDLVLEKYSN